MIIKLNNRKTVDTDGLTYEEMQALALDVDVEINTIKIQLRDVSTRWRETGERADPKWFNAASAALKRKQRDRQELQVLIGIRRRQGAKSTKKQSDFFVEVVKEYLPTEDFKRLSVIAEERYKKKIQEVST